MDRGERRELWGQWLVGAGGIGAALAPAALVLSRCTGRPEPGPRAEGRRRSVSVPAETEPRWSRGDVDRRVLTWPDESAPGWWQASFSGSFDGECRVYALGSSSWGDERVIRLVHLGLFYRTVVLGTWGRIGVATLDEGAPERVGRILWLADELEERTRDFDPGGRVDLFLHGRGGETLRARGRDEPSRDCRGLTLQEDAFVGLSSEEAVEEFVDRLCQYDCPPVDAGGASRRAVHAGVPDPVLPLLWGHDACG